MTRFITLFIIAALVAVPAAAENQNGVLGQRSGCVDFAVTSSWTDFTSGSLENSANDSPLAAGLQWVEARVILPSSTVYVCNGPSAGCGSTPANKLMTPADAVWIIALLGKGVTTVSLRSAAGLATGQLCGDFWVQP